MVEQVTWCRCSCVWTYVHFLRAERCL